MRDKQELLEGLRRTPAILAAFVRTIPANKLDVRRGNGFWTVAEHVSHLAQVQPMLLGRIQRFMAEEHPEFIPYLPGTGKEEPATPPRLEMSAALAQFAEVRSQQLQLLDGADDATWQKSATHPEYDRYSLAILVRHTLLHDYWHMYRMEELWLTKEAYLTRLG